MTETMANDSYFRFDDDNKMKYKYLKIIKREIGKLKTHSPMYCLTQLREWTES